MISRCCTISPQICARLRVKGENANQPVCRNRAELRGSSVRLCPTTSFALNSLARQLRTLRARAVGAMSLWWRGYAKCRWYGPGSFQTKNDPNDAKTQRNHDFLAQENGASWLHLATSRYLALGARKQFQRTVAPISSGGVRPAATDHWLPYHVSVVAHNYHGGVGRGVGAGRGRGVGVGRDVGAENWNLPTRVDQ